MCLTSLGSRFRGNDNVGLDQCLLSFPLCDSLHQRRESAMHVDAAHNTLIFCGYRTGGHHSSLCYATGRCTAAWPSRP
jgi:hypothetical protein